QDAFGNLATLNGNLSLSLATNPAGATLGGVTVVPVAGGLATFAGLTLNRAGAGATLQVSGGGLPTVSSTAINVTPAAATKLVVPTQPPPAFTAGAGFGLVVAAEDGFGNVDPTYAGSVALSLAANPGGATLVGTLTVPVSAGMATFSGLTLNRAAIGV